jgi:hypothetical protein
MVAWGVTWHVPTWRLLITAKKTPGFLGGWFPAGGLGRGGGGGGGGGGWGEAAGWGLAASSATVIQGCYPQCTSA